MPPTRRKTQDQEPSKEEIAEARTIAEAGTIAEQAAGKGLYYKIGLVQHNVAEVEKTGHVDFGQGAKRNKYDHMQEHGLIGVLRDLCAAVKIGYFGGCMGPGQWAQNGNIWSVDFALTVFDMESDQSVTRWYPNVGVDSSDKGLNKAYTGSMKYALQKFFAVPTEGLVEQEPATGQPDTVAQPAAPASGNGVPSSDINELRTLLGAQSGEFINTAMNKVKTYGVDRLEQLTPHQFMEFGNWVENSLADRAAAAE